MNILTGEMLEIDYTALSVLSSEHGFSMNITAYKQPHGKIQFLKQGPQGMTQLNLDSDA